MSSYKEVEGCLIEKSLNGEFDVIAHGCNCFCLQKAGIAAKMSETFNTDKYELEAPVYRGYINKLGQIYFRSVSLDDGQVTVVNAYTQYKPGANLDYSALELCLTKINHTFSGQHIGLPKIGAGIAGGDWNFIKTIIQTTLVDCSVTIVNFKK